MPQFLRHSAETGSAIQLEAVQKIAETMIAGTQAATNQTATSERSHAIKTLRSELRGKEFEIDGLILSLIDFPPRIGEETPRSVAKRALKACISELTEIVNTLRERLSALESDSGDRARH